MIPNTTTAVQFLLNGTTTVYSFPNKIFEATDLALRMFDTAAPPNLYTFDWTSGVLFTEPVTGITATISNIDVDTGCTVTLSTGGTSGWTLDIRTDTPLLQNTSIKNQGQFLPDLHEEEFDYLTRMVQDLMRQTYTFGIHGPDFEATAWTPLPNAANRAGLYLGFDANGLPSVTATVPAGTALSAQVIGGFTGPQTAAESAFGITPVNPQYASGDIRRYGGVGDGVTDDTGAVQSTLNFCIYANLDMMVNGQFLLTSSVAINRLVNGAAFDKYFKIVSRNGGGFVINSASWLGAGVVGMFNSTAATFTTAPISQLIYFDGINFTSSAAGYGYVFADGYFLRTRFHGCSFDFIGGCVSSIGYSQSIQFTNCNIRRGSGVFWQSGSTSGYYSTDFKFNHNLVESWTGDFLHVGLLQGGSISFNCIEGISGTAILMNGAQGVVIAGNYFEGNGLDVDMTGPGGAQTYAVSGLILTGNTDQSGSGTPALTTPQIIWPAAAPNIVAATVGSNYFLNYGHQTPANAHIVGASADTSAAGIAKLWTNTPATDRGNTSWTPSDASGGSMGALTAVSGAYIIPGNTRYVEFDFQVTFPTNSDTGHNATIGGLPFAAASPGVAYPISGITSLSTYTTGTIVLAGAAGGSTFQLYSNGTALTNANLSGVTLRMSGRYQAAI